MGKDFVYGELIAEGVNPMTPDQAKELISLLKEMERLGLTFDCGTAYISRRYVEKQEILRRRVKDVVELLSREVG